MSEKTPSEKKHSAGRRQSLPHDEEIAAFLLSL